MRKRPVFAVSGATGVGTSTSVLAELVLDVVRLETPEQTAEAIAAWIREGL